MSLHDFILGFFRALASFQSRRCLSCGISHCDGTLCGQIVAEGQRIRAMMRQIDGSAGQQALLAPWERYINELAARGKL